MPGTKYNLNKIELKPNSLNSPLTTRKIYNVSVFSQKRKLEFSTGYIYVVEENILHHVIF
jgi:hypothetical protein